ncbi:MAG: ComEC/Rec2 family competence protein [Bacteroidetes bacterium]|nr:ComEC/Rec2 family competence protein [Bacteroidota bacterium]MDA0950902.1 ComEC/Rec2 family competence protein [Bacteroidota bacterium]
MKTPFSLINRLLAYLVSGIYFAELLSPSIYLLLLVCCIYVFSCYYTLFIVQELFLGLLWVLIGAYLLKAEPALPDWPELTVVKVIDYAGKSPKRHKFKAEGIGGSIILYSKDSLESGAIYAAKLQLFDSVYNTSQTRAFIKEYRLVERANGLTFRASMVKRWNTLGISHEPLGLLANVMVGDRTLISSTVKEQFKKLGAAHVLAISGLHVGVLFALLNGLIFFVPQPYRKILLVACLWWYALIAAFSPSVVRATLIFSLYALAHLLKRIPSKAQLLSVSAFLSLLIQPQLLFDLGFLMSYSAVAAIVVCLEPLKAFEPKRKWLRYFYYLAAVSIAAQLGVTPIVLVTFKTISTWFLLGSLALVPLMPFILGLGLLGLTSSFWASICNSWLSSVLKGVNYLAQHIPEPLVIENFDKPDAALYYGVFALLMYLAHQTLDQRRGQKHH